FAAAAVATRYNSRFAGSGLYVIGGIDGAGRAQASVFAADVTADSVVGRLTPIEPLPAPVAGALAVVTRGRIYVIGGTDSVGRRSSPRADRSSRRSTSATWCSSWAACTRGRRRTARRPSLRPRSVTRSGPSADPWGSRRGASRSRTAVR